MICCYFLLAGSLVLVWARNIYCKWVLFYYIYKYHLIDRKRNTKYPENIQKWVPVWGGIGKDTGQRPMISIWLQWGGGEWVLEFIFN